MKPEIIKASIFFIAMGIFGVGNAQMSKPEDNDKRFKWDYRSFPKYNLDSIKADHFKRNIDMMSRMPVIKPDQRKYNMPLAHIDPDTNYTLRIKKYPQLGPIKWDPSDTDRTYKKKRRLKLKNKPL